MFDFDDLDCLEDGLQRLDSPKTRPGHQAQYAHAPRDTATSLKTSSARLVADSQTACQRLTHA